MIKVVDITTLESPWWFGNRESSQKRDLNFRLRMVKESQRIAKTATLKQNLVRISWNKMIISYCSHGNDASGVKS